MCSPPKHWERAAWIGLLGRAPTAALAAAWAATGLAPAYRMIRAPEVGMVMVRGRVGGTGSPFNLGEMTVTRCVVALNIEAPTNDVRFDGAETDAGGAGVHGFGYVSGRREQHAVRAALIDGLLQAGAGRADLEANVLEELAAREHHERAKRASEVAATKVDFFTMVRSES